MQDYILQVAVPKYIQLKIDPASSNTVAASSSSTVTQALHVINSMHGQKPVAVRLRATFKTLDLMGTEQSAVEQGQASFPL